MPSAFFTIGRIVFALPFAIFGIEHFAKGESMAKAVPIPGGVFWVYFTGVALLAGAVGIITKVLGKWASLCLAALMLVFIVFVHIPGLGNAEQRDMNLINLFKDLALCGGAIGFAGYFAEQEQLSHVVPSPTARHAEV